MLGKQFGLTETHTTKYMMFGLYIIVKVLHTRIPMLESNGNATTRRISKYRRMDSAEEDGEEEEELFQIGYGI